MLGKRINDKLVKLFLDLIVMTILNSTQMHGYEILATVHKEFGILLSPGALYPLLHSLEDEGLIKSSHNGGRIVYQISLKGRQKLESTLRSFMLAVEKTSNFLKERNKQVILTV